MHLKGSCHCGAVRFSVESHEPTPYQRCNCSICRKTGGAAGAMINIGGEAATLEVSGKEHTRVYRAQIERDGELVESRHQRIFCQNCGSHLWAFNDRWPELIHPVAGAIDTDLPIAPCHTHMMVGSKANWVPLQAGPEDRIHEGYPDQSLATWHDTHAASTKN